jgi:hypothetical protein
LQQALVQQYLGQAIQGLRSNAKIVQWAFGINGLGIKLLGIQSIWVTPESVNPLVTFQNPITYSFSFLCRKSGWNISFFQQKKRITVPSK